MNHSLFRSLLWAAVAPLATLVLASCNTPPASMAPGSFSTVVIDAGHGGKDNGEAPNRFIAEKTVALDTVRRLQPLLREAGLRTVLTRSDDRFIELDDRVAIANRYAPNAILVSVHYNASRSSTPTGVETFFWRPDSYGLATRVERHLATETERPYRGVTRRVLRLTHNPIMPSILCECGFLTNRTEGALICTDAFRQSVAEGIAAGILEQRKYGDVGLGSLPPVQSNYSSRHSRHHGSRHHHHKKKRT